MSDCSLMVELIPVISRVSVINSIDLAGFDNTVA